MDIGAREALEIIVANEPAPGAESFRLEAPAPNPTRASAELVVHLAEAAPIRLAVYDALGREVALVHDGPLSAGAHPFILEGKGLPNGVYFVRATSTSFRATQTLTIVR